MTIATPTRTERSYRTLTSPLGRLIVAGHGPRVTHLVLPMQLRKPDLSHWAAGGERGCGTAVTQLSAYFAGELSAFDVELDLAGTEFQRRVWAAVQTIPYGETRSYADIADQVGSPGSSRAVGMAVGRNPVPVIMPCHRVIGSAGGLTGYVGGVEAKRSLLSLEGGRRWS